MELIESSLTMIIRITSILKQILEIKALITYMEMRHLYHQERRNLANLHSHKTFTIIVIVINSEPQGIIDLQLNLIAIFLIKIEPIILVA